MKLKKTVINGQTVYVEVQEGQKDEDTIEVIKMPKVDIPHMAEFDAHFYRHHHHPRDDEEDLEKEEREEKDDDDEDEEADEDEVELSPKMKKLMRMLPFLGEEDLHVMLDKILADDEAVKGLSLVHLMPFLGEEDCDRLFLKALEKGEKISQAMVPFVSEKCLAALVDAYMEGKQKDLDVDMLYPFLDSATLKKLLHYELAKQD